MTKERAAELATYLSSHPGKLPGNMTTSEHNAILYAWGVTPATWSTIDILNAAARGSVTLTDDGGFVLNACVCDDPDPWMPSITVGRTCRRCMRKVQRR